MICMRYTLGVQIMYLKHNSYTEREREKILFIIVIFCREETVENLLHSIRLRLVIGCSFVVSMLCSKWIYALEDSCN